MARNPFSDTILNTNRGACAAFGVVTPVDWLTEFRGTRPAQAISAVLFLGLGLYNLAFDPGRSALWIGIPFSILGLFMSYKFLVVPSDA